MIGAGIPRGGGGALARWQRFAAERDVEITASWLIVGSELELREAREQVGGAFRGVMTAATPAALSAVVRRLERAAARSAVVTSFDTVSARCDALRRAGKRLVFTNGVFDLFHIGHVRMLRAARALGDSLVVGINSDSSARRLKGRARPTVPQFARAEIVAAVRGVDFCAIFDQDDPRELLRAARPHILAKGGEYTLAGVVGRRLVEGWGGRVVLLPHVGGWSSSRVRSSVRGERQ